VIEEQAKSLGDRVAVTMTTGERLTYRELRDDAARVAGMLAAAGAGRRPYRGHAPERARLPARRATLAYPSTVLSV